VFAAIELGPARHVLAVSVGVPGADDDLQGILRLENGGGGQQFQVLNTGILGARSGSAAGNPVREETVIRRARFGFFPAAVPDRLRRLEQKQTASRLAAIDTPS